MPADWENAGFGIYVHWPFCQAKCPYCDFNSYVRREVDIARWRQAFLTEIERYRAETGLRVVNTIFFGGGTPSLMPPDLVGDIIAAIKASWPVANDIEITLEANPTSVEAGRFRAFRDAGVRRVSIGVQSLRDEHLRALGRMHSANEAMAAMEVAQSVFDRVSGDLIYARQHQSLSDWRVELAEALALGTEHLSLYQLTIEDGTVFGDRFKLGRLKGLPDDDMAADFWDTTQELCSTAGRPSYEVSNHAAPGEESRHNLIYWRYGDYLGIGPGAHGRLTTKDGRAATEAVRAPNAWLDAVEQNRSGESKRSEINISDQSIEYLMMSLRLQEGCDLTRLFTLDPSVIKDAEMQHLEELGLLRRDGNRIACTDEGMPVLNSVIRTLVA